MTAEDVLAAVSTLNPRSLARARRLVAAVDLIRQGKSRSEAVAVLRERFAIDRGAVWRLVDIAIDLAGPTTNPATTRAKEPA